MSLLEAKDLVFNADDRALIRDVSLSLESHSLTILVGPNGAGKTTSFRMICGMIDPDEGSVRLNGQDVTSWPMHRRAAEGGMGYLAQESSVFRKLTVEQNLLRSARMIHIRSHVHAVRHAHFYVHGLTKPTLHVHELTMSVFSPRAYASSSPASSPSFLSPWQVYLRRL